MQVLILAAGKGSRMASLTQSNHKSLLPINENDSFLSHLLHKPLYGLRHHSPHIEQRNLFFINLLLSFAFPGKWI